MRADSMFSRLNLSFEPPSNIEQGDYPDFYGITVSAVSGFVVNAILLLGFLSAQHYMLAALSISGAIAWVVVLVLAQKGQFTLAICVGMLEMMLHTGFIVTQIGTAYGGQLILWAAIAYAAFTASDKKHYTRILSYLCLVEMVLLYTLVPERTAFTAFEQYIGAIFIVLTLCSSTPLMTVLLFIKSEQIRDSKRLRFEANHDSLTRLFNRGFFDTLLDYDRNTLASGGGPFCICLADIDHFKRVNDEHGHDVGDEVLVDIATLISQHLRKSDAVCRWGGEEFAIILRRCNMDDAPLVIEKIRNAINSAPISSENLSITMSFGLVQASQNESTDSLIKRSDALLYQAKSQGRDQLVY
ncbi:GGDEF domain-containing protein [Ningiella sp. W23]|uniref:GGDEF domain-containing protein n=1 Tax=Ningiella sp. W23 TaxID=3023715 RepID=UPI0037584353